jgi:hypothetical protein
MEMARSQGFEKIEADLVEALYPEAVYVSE